MNGTRSFRLLKKRHDLNSLVDFELYKQVYFFFAHFFLGYNQQLTLHNLGNIFSKRVVLACFSQIKEYSANGWSQ